ncbi:SSI family serine proteinase inhibitor [Streptomyces polyrhachis]|uniref:SSI family serine proteinase inhibitor n=1 Tax=Streptomyces polyrhachis TaxID=1282885 RepID=A0ABW2GDJ3_9ACTN
MRNTMRNTSLVAAGSAVAALLLAAPALAADTAAGQPPVPGDLLSTLSVGHSPLAVSVKPPKGTTTPAEVAHTKATSLLLATQRLGSDEPLDVAYLNCEPAGGTHPKAAKACKALRAAGGRFNALKPAQGACTMEFAPVRVYAFGHWKGKPVAWVSEIHANRCAANLATAKVFDY